MINYTIHGHLLFSLFEYTVFKVLEAILLSQHIYCSSRCCMKCCYIVLIGVFVKQFMISGNFLICSKRTALLQNLILKKILLVFNVLLNLKSSCFTAGWHSCLLLSSKTMLMCVLIVREIYSHLFLLHLPFHKPHLFHCM